MANYLFNIETIPRTLGKYIVHRATCGIRVAPLQNIGGAVNEYEGLGLAADQFGGYDRGGYERVTPCAYCMPDASSLKGGGWPFIKQEEKPSPETLNR